MYLDCLGVDLWRALAIFQILNGRVCSGMSPFCLVNFETRNLSRRASLLKSFKTMKFKKSKGAGFKSGLRIRCTPEAVWLPFRTPIKTILPTYHTAITLNILYSHGYKETRFFSGSSRNIDVW